jgi:ribosomal protein L11 methyltransferase
MYKELVVIVARDVAENLSDMLMELGVLSVQAEDADADTTDEVAIFAEPGEPVGDNAWRRTRLIALLDPQSSASGEELLAQAASQCGLTEPLAPTFREVADQDWVSLTQSQFDPIPIGPRLTIRPSWHQAVDIGKTEVILDPGLAFGTGSHPTTRMCLEWIEQCMPEDVTVIDYGCGSGILAIAAAKLGARSVVAVDIDEQAVLSTQNNAQNNHVELVAHNTRQAAPKPAQVVLANILANPLKVLAPALEALVLPGGTLILAGLLDRQVLEVAAAYTDINMSVFRSREGWSCLTGTKPGLANT